jgi:hypothetical protein
MMAVTVKPDMSCVPYRRKGLYFALTVPLFLILIAVFVYLWTYSFVLSLIFSLFYLIMCYFQAYCCVHQDCPYVGGFCPAVMGIVPGNIMAKRIYANKNVLKSKRKFELHATIAIFAWLAIMVFPLLWIAKLGMAFSVGYVACHVVYYAVFGLTICPVCAIRNTCPGGKFQAKVLGRDRGS